MIQRIQTIFLLAVVILSGFLLNGDIVRMAAGNSTVFSLGFTGLGYQGGEVIQRLWPMSVILAIVPLLALVSVFLYRNRPLQMRFTMIVLLLSVGTLILGAFYVLMLDRKIGITVVWTVKVVFPLVSALLAWLAWRAILRDDARVRSYDRLR